MTQQQNIQKPGVLKGEDIFSSLDQIQKSIQERAYQIFQDRDPNSGDAISDWLIAESEILSDINLTLNDNENEVRIEGKIDKFLPGDIEVKAQDGQFTICGIHTAQTSSEEEGQTSDISPQSNFYRSFSLPDSVDTEKMVVEMKKGKFVAKIPKITH